MSGNQKKSLHGVMPALGTPLEGGRKLHEEGMRQQVKRQIEGGVDALLCLGTMGMAQMHTPEVREQAIRVTMEAAAGRVPVLVGCADCSTARTQQYISTAERYHPDGIVLIPPYFPVLTDDELADYYGTLAASTSIPIYIYDNPYYTHRPISFDLVKRLSDKQGIAGLKASGDLGTFRDCVEYFRDHPSFGIFSGHSSFFDATTLMGADGIIDGLFALAPKVGVEIYSAASKQDVNRAREAQGKLKSVRDVVLVESVFPAFSYAMNLLGCPGEYYCPPMRDISAEGKAKVRKMMAELEMI